MRKPKFLRILENLKEFEHYRRWLIEVKVIERNEVTLATPESPRYGYDLQGRQLRIDKPNGVIQRTEVNSSGSVTRMREFGPDNTPHDLADNPKRSEFLYSLDAAGRRTSMIEKFWLDADNNVNTPDVPKQNAYTWTYDANGKLLSEVLDSFDDAADRTDTFVMDLFGNRRKRTTVSQADCSINRTMARRIRLPRTVGAVRDNRARRS